MLCATKVYNGLIWHLRDEFERTGQTKATRKHLNAALKSLPRTKAYYSLSVQATRDDLSLGTGRQDGVKSVAVTLQMRQDVSFQRVRNVLLTYDKTHGLYAHLVVEVAAKRPLGNRRVAVDLGETQAITAIFDDGATLLYSGRLIKSIRRYWNKVRARVKPPTAENKRKSRRFRQIEGKESRQVEHLLHILTADFVHRCWLAGVDTIAVGDLTGIRERIDYTDKLNQRLHAWPFRKIVSMVTYKAGTR